MRAVRLETCRRFQSLGLVQLTAGAVEDPFPHAWNPQMQGFGLVVDAGSDANHHPCNDRPHMRLSVMLIGLMTRICLMLGFRQYSPR